MFEVPEHLEVPVNSEGDGPLDADEKPWAYICWCQHGMLCTVIKARLAESRVNTDDPVET